MHAFILAGGFATRLWPLTESRAKPLLPLAGKPILSHLVEKIPTGIPITVSTNAVFADQFHDWKQKFSILQPPSRLRPAGNSPAFAKATAGRQLSILIEDSKHDDHKLGALGATAQWITREGIDEDVLLLTGDNYLGFSMEKFLQSYDGTTPLLAAYDIADLEKAKHFGVVVTETAHAHSPPPVGEGLGAGETKQQTIRSFQEKPEEPASTLVSTGCSILPQKTLSILTAYATAHPDNVGGIFEEFLRRDIAVHCFTFTEPWLDIGSFHSYLAAHRLLVGGRTLAATSAQVTASDLQGSVTIGEGSEVEGCVLRDCMIFDRCRITDCELRDCIVDDDCVLEGVDLRGKMLRAGTVLRAR